MLTGVRFAADTAGHTFLKAHEYSSYALGGKESRNRIQQYLHWLSIPTNGVCTTSIAAAVPLAVVSGKVSLRARMPLSQVFQWWFGLTCGGVCRVVSLRRQQTLPWLSQSLSTCTMVSVHA